MSMLAPFERLFDTAAVIDKRMREGQAAVRHNHTDDQGDPPTYRCRVCELLSPEAAYCPDCLADTMQLVRATVADP